MKNKEIILKKHGAMIQTNVKELTMVQRKLVNSLLSLVQKTGNQEIYKSTISYFKNTCNITSTQNLDFKEQMLSLIKIVIEFNYLNKDHKHVWEAMPLLAGAKIIDEHGNIEFAMSPFLKEKILKPDMYAPLNVKLIAGFKSSYSIILYELLRDYLTAVKIPKITIEEFRDLMGVKKHEYKMFKDLKNRVIEIAINEVNKKSDINCSYKLIRDNENSSKYTHIQLFASLKEQNLNTIFKNEENENELILLEKQENKMKEKIEIPEEIISEIPEKYRIKSLFEEINKKVKEDKNVNYIKLNLKYAFKKANENPIYYAINALKNNYAGFDIEIEEKKILEKKSQLAVINVSEKQKKQEEMALDAIRSLSPEKYENLYEEAKSLNIKENPGNSFFLNNLMIEIRMAKMYMERSERNNYQSSDND